MKTMKPVEHTGSGKARDRPHIRHERRSNDGRCQPGEALPHSTFPDPMELAQRHQRDRERPSRT
jgi:hypothetical protein